MPCQGHLDLRHWIPETIPLLNFGTSLSSTCLTGPSPPCQGLTPSHLVGAEKCQKPQWDSRFIFDQEQEIFNPNEVVKIQCPEGYWPPPMEIKCVTFKPREGSMIPRTGWGMRSGTDAWQPVKGNLTCVDVRQVVPKIPEISSTSIKLKWTCRFPHMCQNIRARCQTEWHSSSDCETEEVKVEEMLQGWEGTFICSPLQPFTVYSVTISRLPSTILYADLHTTKEMVPDKPEKLWVDTSTGSLRWKPLSSCKGEIIGYQLNITARNAGDSSVLETERLRLDGSVTEHRLPGLSPGSSYAVMLQGLTAAGAGAALTREFHSNSNTPHPQAISCRGARDIDPSQGTAVLPLSPIAPGSEAAREHQLIVAATHNASLIESICSEQAQLSNASAYRAALLNLSAATDFVLGDGSRGQGTDNAALSPGRDYTALLRLVRRGPQAVALTLAFVFVAGQTVDQWHWIVIGLVVLLAVILVAAVILWLVHSRLVSRFIYNASFLPSTPLCLFRKRKYLPNKTKDDN
uniref:Fibronectin type-III domain-containing protein n=1 Tax=Junco hyemalis TaxID=40217 RepID=A0A8C5JFK4_JUNHY